MSIKRNVITVVLSLGLVAFLFLGSFGFSHAGMTMQADATMNDCPFTLGASICNMTPLEMIAASQSMFNVLPQQKDLASLLLLSILAALALTTMFAPFSPPRFALSRDAVWRRRYIPVSHALQELFSSGILNPKLY